MRMILICARRANPLLPLYHLRTNVSTIISIYFWHESCINDSAVIANENYSHLGTLAGARVPAQRARVKRKKKIFFLQILAPCARNSALCSCSEFDKIETSISNGKRNHV